MKRLYSIIYLTILIVISCISLTQGQQNTIVLNNPASRVRKMDASPDGQWLASIHEDNLVRIWYASNGGLYNTLEGHLSKIKAIAFSPDGKYLISGDENGDIREWLLSDGKCTRIYRQPHPSEIRSLSFSNDGKYIAVGTFRGWYVLDEFTQQIAWEIPQKSNLPTGIYSIESLRFSADDKVLYVATLYDVYSYRLYENLKEYRSRFFTETDGELTSMSISADGRFLAAGGGQNGLQVKIYELPTLKHLCTTFAQYSNRDGIFWLEWQPATELDIKRIVQWEPMNRRIVHYKLPQSDRFGTGQIVYGEHGGKYPCEGVKVWNNGSKTYEDEKSFLPVIAVNGKSYVGLANGVLARSYRAATLPNPIQLEPFMSDSLEDYSASDITNLVTIPDKREKGAPLADAAPTDDGRPRILFTKPVFSKSYAPLVRLTIQVESTLPLHDNFSVTLNNVHTPCQVDVQNACDCALNLAKGNNTITVSVSNNAGFSSAFTRTIEYTPVVQYQGLFIITDQYKDSVSWPSIPTIRQIAQDLSKLLEQNYHFNIKYLYNPTKEEILAQLDALRHRTFEPNDHLLILIAGHSGKDGSRGYLTPYDASGGFKDNSSAYIRYVSLFNDYLRNIPCQHQLLVLEGSFASLQGNPCTELPQQMPDPDPLRKVPFGKFLCSDHAFRDARAPSQPFLLRALLDFFRSNRKAQTNFDDLQSFIAKSVTTPVPFTGAYKEHEQESRFIFIH